MRIGNPRASYRAENPTNPKIGQKYQPDMQIPPTAENQKNTRKYPKNTQKYEFRIFLVFQGVFEGVFRGVSCFVCWGVFLHFVGFPILQLVEGLSIRVLSLVCRGPLGVVLPHLPWEREQKKPINRKNFGGTPPSCVSRLFCGNVLMKKRGGATPEVSLSEENCPLEALRGSLCSWISHRKTSERSSQRLWDFFRGLDWSFPFIVAPPFPLACPICPVKSPVCPADILPLELEFPHKSDPRPRGPQD